MNRSRHLDAAAFGDAAEIVADQIHDHQILGAVLGAGRKPGSLGRVIAARAPRVPFIGRTVIAPSALRSKNSSGDRLRIWRSPSSTKAAMGAQPLAARSLHTKRRAIAQEGKAGAETEIGLIDVARGDVVLHPGEAPP